MEEMKLLGAKMDKYEYTFPIRVLVYKEDGEIIAHAIDMDIVADGKSEIVAKRNLMNLVVNQISCALQKEQEHLIWRTAPKEYLERWDAAQTSSLKAIASDSTFNWKAKATVICLSEKDKEKLRNAVRRQEFQENVA